MANGSTGGGAENSLAPPVANRRFSTSPGGSRRGSSAVTTHNYRQREHTGVLEGR